MHFCIQTIDGEIVHDFAWTLIDALRYWKWRGDPHTYNLTETVDYQKDAIPVGSVEFVQHWLSCHMYPEAKPRNVPVEIFPVPRVRTPLMLVYARGSQVWWKFTISFLWSLWLC